jgi:hypothetical protein
MRERTTGHSLGEYEANEKLELRARTVSVSKRARPLIMSSAIRSTIASSAGSALSLRNLSTATIGCAPGSGTGSISGISM